MRDQDERGRFVAGNTAALVTGAYSRQVQTGTLEAQAEALAAMAESQQAIVADLGGDTELSQRQRDMVRSYLRLGLIEDFAFMNIEKSGVFTTKGAQRAVVNTLMKAIAQAAGAASCSSCDGVTSIWAAAASICRPTSRRPTKAARSSSPRGCAP